MSPPTLASGPPGGGPQSPWEHLPPVQGLGRARACELWRALGRGVLMCPHVCTQRTHEGTLARAHTPACVYTQAHKCTDLHVHRNMYMYTVYLHVHTFAQCACTGVHACTPKPTSLSSAPSHRLLVWRLWSVPSSGLLRAVGRRLTRPPVPTPLSQLGPAWLQDTRVEEARTPTAGGPRSLVAGRRRGPRHPLPCGVRIPERVTGPPWACPLCRADGSLAMCSLRCHRGCHITVAPMLDSLGEAPAGATVLLGQ